MSGGTLITQINPGETFTAHGIRYRLVRRYRPVRPGMVLIEVKNLDGGGHSMGQLSDLTRFPVKRR